MVVPGSNIKANIWGRGPGVVLSEIYPTMITRQIKKRTPFAYQTQAVADPYHT